jgi:hypothetical protein
MTENERPRVDSKQIGRHAWVVTTYGVTSSRRSEVLRDVRKALREPLPKDHTERHPTR